MRITYDMNQLEAAITQLNKLNMNQENPLTQQEVLEAMVRACSNPTQAMHRGILFYPMMLEEVLHVHIMTPSFVAEKEEDMKVYAIDLETEMEDLALGWLENLIAEVDRSVAGGVEEEKDEIDSDPRITSIADPDKVH
jgi:hypothetical protein